VVGAIRREDGCGGVGRCDGGGTVSGGELWCFGFCEGVGVGAGGDGGGGVEWVEAMRSW